MNLITRLKVPERLSVVAIAPSPPSNSVRMAPMTASNAALSKIGSGSLVKRRSFRSRGPNRLSSPERRPYSRKRNRNHKAEDDAEGRRRPDAAPEKRAQCTGRPTADLFGGADDRLLPQWLLPHRAAGCRQPYGLRRDDRRIPRLLQGQRQ